MFGAPEVLEGFTERLDTQGPPAREYIQEAGIVFRVGMDAGVRFGEQEHDRYAMWRELRLGLSHDTRSHGLNRRHHIALDDPQVV